MAINSSSTPHSVPLTTLKTGSRFFTTLTLRPGIYRGRYNFGGLTVEWEDTGKIETVHTFLLVIPAEWDNLNSDTRLLQKVHQATGLMDAPGADYSVA